jgi:hypothetical protein
MRYRSLAVAILLLFGVPLVFAQRTGGASTAFSPSVPASPAFSPAPGGPGGHFQGNGFHGARPNGSFARNHAFRRFDRGNGFFLPWYVPDWDYDDPAFWEDSYNNYDDYYNMGPPPGYDEMANQPPPPVVVERNHGPQMPPTPVASPKLVEVPDAGSGGPQTQQPAVFVLANGQQIESSRYVLSDKSLKIDEGSQLRTIPLSAVNIDATVAANQQRGIDMTIPRDNSSLFVSF